MAKLIVHIGHGKTGSSSIQRTLLEGRQTLRDAGVAYLGLMLEYGYRKHQKPWQRTAGSDAFFSAGRRPEKANDEVFEVLEKTLDELDRDGIKTAIWSNEWLAQRAAYALPALQQLATAGHEIEVQCYVRRHDNWLLSAYSQWGIKHKAYNGPVVPFQDWQKVQGGNRVTFWADLAPWEDAFGGAFRLFNFDRIEDVVRHFLDINQLPELPSHKENASPSPVNTAAQALFNSLQKAEVKPAAFRRVSQLMDAQEKITLPALDELFPKESDLLEVLSQSKDDIARINELLVRQGQPQLDFSEPPAVLTHPTTWEMDQYILRLIFALNEEVQKLRDCMGEQGSMVSHKPNDAVDKAVQPAGLSKLPLESVAGHEPTRLGQAPAQAAVEVERDKEEIVLLQERLAAAEQKSEALAIQLRKLTQPHLRDVRDRLRLAIALDEPESIYSADIVLVEVQRLRREAAEARTSADAVLDEVQRLRREATDARSSADAVSDEVQRMRREAADARSRMQQREAELLSSTSWRVTAPLRAISRVLGRRRA